MEIKLFDADFEDRNYLNLEEYEFNETMKDLNISFSVEECSRLVSHVICETLDSYTQQSQRYVRAGNYTIPKELENSKEYQEIVEKIFKLYSKMSELKEKVNPKGRPKESDFKYGIKIEDARYILPIAVKTNVFVTMSGDKLVNFFRLIKSEKQEEFKELENKLKEYFPEALWDKIQELAKPINWKEIWEKQKGLFDKIDKDIVFLNGFENPLLRCAMGAATSTNALPASEFSKNWTDEKAKELVSRVLNYGHTSIIEHARTRFGIKMSLTCYHQFERHRLPRNKRERFELIPIERTPIIPPSIQANKEILEEFNNLVQEVKQTRKKIAEEISLEASCYLLLNCDILKLITTTNARMDNDILSERTCNNAQWEIRNLYIKKLEILKQISPVIYDKAGPPCTRGKCPEGNLSCGKMIEMREKFGYFGKDVS